RKAVGSEHPVGCAAQAVEIVDQLAGARLSSDTVDLASVLSLLAQADLSVTGRQLIEHGGVGQGLAPGKGCGRQRWCGRCRRALSRLRRAFIRSRSAEPSAAQSDDTETQCDTTKQARHVSEYTGESTRGIERKKTGQAYWPALCISERSLVTWSGPSQWTPAAAPLSSP